MLQQFFPAFFFLFLNVILIVTLSATFPHHHITPLDSLVTHLGVSVFCHSRVVKVSLTFHLSAWAPLLGLVLSTWAKWPAAFLFLFFFYPFSHNSISLLSSPLSLSHCLWQLGGSSVWLQLQSSGRSSSRIPAFKWNKQDGWLLTEGHQPWAQCVHACVFVCIYFKKIFLWL